MGGVYPFPKIKKLRNLNTKIIPSFQAYLKIYLFNYHHKWPKLKS